MQQNSLGGDSLHVSASSLLQWISRLLQPDSILGVGYGPLCNIAGHCLHHFVSKCSCVCVDLYVKMLNVVMHVGGVSSTVGQQDTAAQIAASVNVHCRIAYP